jgi:hypothetical protein
MREFTTSFRRMCGRLCDYRLITAVVACLAFAAPSSAAIVSYQQGASTPFLGGAYSGNEDTMLARNNNFNGAADQNFGGRADFAVGGRASDSFHRHSLIRFDVTSMAGEFSSIDAITLRLHFSVNSATFTDKNDTIQVYQVASANTGWIEGNLNGSTAAGGQSTWYHRNATTNNWAGSLGASTAGTDYVNTVLASTAFDRTELAGDVFDLVFTDTSFFANWVAGTNPGLFLRAQTGTQAAQVIFHSSEAGTAAFRPELIITYTPIPEPSTFALVISGGIAMELIRRLRKRS